MVRPKKERHVLLSVVRNEGDVLLTDDEMEALRLVDMEKRSQVEAASIMGISQPTLSRLLLSAREKVAYAVINGLSVGVVNVNAKRGDNMNVKIGVATSKGGLDDMVSPVFGRCETFTIVNVVNGSIESVEVIQNPGRNEQRGAGIAAAQALINKGVNVVISGNIGPTSSGVLTSAGVRYVVVSGISVKEAVESYISGKITSQAPQQFGQGWGIGRGLSRCRGRGMGRGRRRGGIGRGLGGGRRFGNW